MKSLRYMTLALLITAGIFLNIERIDFGVEENVVNIQSFVYALAGLVAVVGLIFPFMRRLPISLWMLLWIGVFFLGKLGLSFERPIFGGNYTYLTITELFIISLISFLSQRVSWLMHDAEETIANITLADVNKRVRKFEDAEDDISRELIRSRRYSLPLSVLLVEPDQASFKASLHYTAQQVMKTLMSRYMLNSLVRIIDDEVRRTDLLLEQSHKNRFVLVLPDANRENIAPLIERIKRIAAEKLGLSVSYGLASFPDDAFTFDDLIARAENELTSEQGFSLVPGPAELRKKHKPLESRG